MTIRRSIVGLNYVLSAGFLGVIATGCATVVPPELVNARQEYNVALLGPTAEVAPAELHKAKMSLDKAEKAFLDEPEAQRTRDLAYVADRKAQLAVAIAETKTANRQGNEANEDYQANEKNLAVQTKGKLSATRKSLAASERSRREGVKDLGDERNAREKAEQEAADYKRREQNAQDALAKLAAIKDEARGLVITLSGSVLFASNQAMLLPAAQTRLNEVAKALLETDDRNLVIEGHTDSQGSAGYNIGLSQRRADAVRSYLISRGYTSDRIQAHGIGEDRPVANNANTEGRANNRRVEIVVQRKLGASL